MLIHDQNTSSIPSKSVRYKQIQNFTSVNLQFGISLLLISCHSFFLTRRTFIAWMH